MKKKYIPSFSNFAKTRMNRITIQRIFVFVLLVLPLFSSTVLGQSREIRTYSDYFPDSGKPRVKAKYYFDNWSEEMVYHGRYSEWSKKGIMRLDGYFLEGIQDSVHRHWNRKGFLCEIASWKEGEREGKTQLYGRKERLRSEKHYSQDKLEGVSYQYYRNGNIKTLSVFQNGYLNGSMTYFNRKGVPKRTRYFDRGKKIDPPEKDEISDAGSPAEK